MMPDTILNHFENVQEFEDILEEAEANAVSQTEMEFVDDLSNKFTQFAENTYCSDRQAEFLRRHGQMDPTVNPQCLDEGNCGLAGCLYPEHCMPKKPEQRTANPWREHIEGVLAGRSEFKVSDWHELLADLDRLYGAADEKDAPLDEAMHALSHVINCTDTALCDDCDSLVRGVLERQEGAYMTERTAKQLVDELRKRAANTFEHPTIARLASEAADEIERLELANEHLRAALNKTKALGLADETKAPTAKPRR